MSETIVSRATINELVERVKELYMSDSIPWVIGYSGGKDSTAVLQLVWYSLKELSADRRHKPVYVISTDTLVEQPVVAKWVSQSLGLMKVAAAEQELPIHPKRLTPVVKDTYWVNLIGRGYPAPRQNFRWCTSRLKIDPSNRFITNMVKTHGEAILVLGTRKAESSARAALMNRYEARRIRQWLSPNVSLLNSLVFSPIEEWSSDNVWWYLNQYKNPWGRDNRDLLNMYRGASADNECPLVVDTSTPSCGNSRFGCWVCTLVSNDKSMQAMIQNDEEKAWMLPLLEFRNEIAVFNPLEPNAKINDSDRRDYRRMNGTIKINPRTGRPIPGPYIKEWRERFLRRLLEVEMQVQNEGPEDVRQYRLITDDEMREIRRIWVQEKHEFDDQLPRIYQDVTGKAYPYFDDLEQGPFGKDEWDLLRSLCGDDHVYLELQASLLDVELGSRGVTMRKSLTDTLEHVIRRCFYANEDDALEFQKRREASLTGTDADLAQVGMDEEQEEGSDCDDHTND